jgi:hypothetical protein
MPISFHLGNLYLARAYSVICLESIQVRYPVSDAARVRTGKRHNDRAWIPRATGREE